MDNQVFYHCIDRIMPRSYFCLDDSMWVVLNEDYCPTDKNIKNHYYFFPDKYNIVPIKDAVKHIFLSCIDSKYKFIIIDRMSKYIYCITQDLSEYLFQYRQPRHVSEIASINHTGKYMFFFKELLILGFLQFSDSLSKDKVYIDINAKISSLQKQFIEIMLLRQRGTNLCFIVKDILGQRMFLKIFLHSGIDEKSSFAKKMSIIEKLQDSDYFLKLLHYDIESMFYVIQYFEGKNLEEICFTMSINTKIEIINQIVRSVAFLHSRNIVHGDLHLGQFLLSNDGKLKMIDYDMVADITDNNLFPYMGATCEYIEPESLSRNPFILLHKHDLNFKAEIYRLGVLIYTIVYGNPPFHELTWGMLYKSKLKREIRFETIDNNGNLIPSVLVSIMKRCLLKCPKKRFSSACEIIPYLNSIDFEHRNENDSPWCMR